MLSRPLAFAVLAAGCMAAAAGGAYMAMRQEAAEVLPVATAAAPAAVQDVGEPAPLMVRDTPTPSQPPVAREETVERRSAARPVVRRRVPPRPSTTNRAPETARAEAPASRTPDPLPPAPVEPLPLPATPADPPAPQFVEVTVPAETVLGVQIETTVSSERARVEDRVEGRVTRDVTVGDRIAIPAGTRLLGSVTLVDRGGKFRERARVAVRFHTAVMRDGTETPLTTSAVMREGESPARESAAKVGGSAVGGAIIGAILGGAKGAVIGGTAGAGAGGAVVAAGGRNAATLPAGTQVSVRLMSDLVLTLER